MNVYKEIEKLPVVEELRRKQETVWVNPEKKPFSEAVKKAKLTMDDVEDAEKRLERFAPFIMKCFPETRERKGIIESPLSRIPRMQKRLNEKYGSGLKGRLFLKMDSHLAIAGSVKARGGIYEVLKHTEKMAFKHGLLQEGDSYEKLASPECRAFFENYTIQVGSTGNLGMSIGIMGAAIGYKVIVHMSADAKEWKKKLLRAHGVEVREYDSDYGEAVRQGRRLSNADPQSYFVDDENSKSLFLGYSVAAKRLLRQLEEQKIQVDEEHPLFVYIPCGVGGAPGGVSFGLKQVFKDAVHCFFVEPTEAPCMLLGMATGLQNEISVQDIGLSGLTHADGLAVGRPSAFVGQTMKPHFSGGFTVSDPKLYHFMRDLLDTEEIFLEPSACAAFQGPARIMTDPETEEYLKQKHLRERMDQAVHIAWATGGSLVPEEIREEYMHTFSEEES